MFTAISRGTILVGWNLVLTATLCAQTPAPSAACNNLTRQLLIAGGTTTTSINCGSWSLAVNIFGQALTISSPPQCLTSTVVRTGDTFNCSGSANLIHCNANGDSITITTMLNPNPCPGFPATPIVTLADVRAASACGPLANAGSEVNTSASIRNCGTSASLHARTDGEIVVESQDTFTVRVGDPASLLAPPVPNETLLRLESAQTAPITALPEPLRSVAVANSTVLGFTDILAQVEFVFRPIGSTEPTVNRYRIEGCAFADGRFAVEKTSRATGEGGEALLATNELVFDGATLFSHLRGSSTGNAWASTSSQQKAMIAAQAEPARMLTDWAYNPYWITRFPGNAYTVGTASSLALVPVHETYPGFGSSGGVLGSTTYIVDTTTTPKPVRIDTKGADGVIVRSREFSDHRLVAAGVWRPFKVIESRWESGATLPWVVIAMTIQEAVLAGSATSEQFLRPQVEDDYWFVRR